MLKKSANCDALPYTTFALLIKTIACMQTKTWVDREKTMHATIVCMHVATRTPWQFGRSKFCQSKCRRMWETLKIGSYANIRHPLCVWPEHPCCVWMAFMNVKNDFKCPYLGVKLGEWLMTKWQWHPIRYTINNHCLHWLGYYDFDICTYTLLEGCKLKDLFFHFVHKK
jgi:hypothetical protein